MNRCKVISHMYVSIDGKIDGDYMDEQGCDISGKYYDDIIFQLGDSMAGGRVTNVMYHAHENVDFEKFKDVEVDDKDYVVKDINNHYHFCFDRNGKSNWKSARYIYGGVEMQNVSVLSKNVKKEYLAFLRSINVSYIIVDTLEEALIKIKNLFKVDTLVLTGGALINGGFHKDGLIDELSLVVAPYIEGNHNYKGYAELDSFINHKYVCKSIKVLNDGGIHLIFKKENK